MLAASACNTYADDLSRSQRAFEESEHERALAILRALEPDVGAAVAHATARTTPTSAG